MQQSKKENLKLFKIVHSERYIQIQSHITAFKTQILIDKKNESIIYESIIFQLTPERQKIFAFDTENQSRHVSLILGIIQTKQAKFLIFADHVYLQPSLPPKNASVYQIASIDVIPFDKRIHKNDEELIDTLKNEIFNFSFYFSLERDLTLRNQTFYSGAKAKSIKKYFWNQQMIDSIMKDKIVDEWRIPVIQGHYTKFQSFINDSKITYALITRRSKFRSGMRFYSRGIDEEGNCSNQTQTEQIIVVQSLLLSSVFISGSSPIFWEQKSQTNPIRLTRNKELTKGPFLEHIKQLNQEYGNVMLVNLLEKKKEGQNLLIKAYQQLFSQTQQETQQFCRYCYFDINDAMKINNYQTIINTVTKFDKILNSFSCFIFDLTQFKIKSKQGGIFRISCLDCLNRTSKFMQYLAIQTVKFMLQVLGTPPTSFLANLLSPNEEEIIPFVKSFKHVWNEKADYESLIYSGSRAATGRKDKFLDELDNSFVSLQRLYNQKFLDRMKQAALDIILYNTKRFHKNWSSTTHKKYTSPFRISMVTWNVNATDPQKLNLRDVIKRCDDCELIVLGLQQMMELHPNNVVIAEEETKISGIWEKNLIKTISQVCEEKFIFIQKIQMVGLLLILFINQKWKNSLKSVQKDTVKTGMGGTFGNKGGVVIRVNIFDTSLCFVSAHLAAGQSKVKQRIDDFCQIHKKAFQQNKSGMQNETQIEFSDHKFFLGDLNFRIKGEFKDFSDLIDYSKNPNESEVNKQKLIEQMWSKDQLLQLRKQSEATYHLASYSQQIIKFLPTYKLEKATGYYTTEKSRNPSWCDRILFWSDDLQNHTCQCTQYTSLNVTGSDHRPVLGNFTVSVLKQEKKIVENEITSLGKQFRDTFFEFDFMS